MIEGRRQKREGEGEEEEGKEEGVEVGRHSLLSAGSRHWSFSPPPRLAGVSAALRSFYAELLQVSSIPALHARR